MLKSYKENWSYMSTIQRFGYFCVRFLSKIQQLCYHYIIGEPVWRCADGTCIPISKIKDKHLDNIINMLERSKEQDNLLYLFKLERACRFISKEESMSV